MQGRECSIELRADGTFAATNAVPIVLGGIPTNLFQSLVTCVGTWRIASTGGVADGSGKVKTCWGVFFESNKKLEAVGFTGDKRPYGMIYTLGDPDEGR